MDTRELFERYGDAVFRLAWSCTGSRQDAEDVTQTVFLKVLERRPDLEPGKERARKKLRERLEEEGRP